MFNFGHRRWRESLSDYIDNRLEGPRRTKLERHLEACVSCQEELTTLKTTVEALRRLPPVVPGRSFAVSGLAAMPMPKWFGSLRLATSVAALLLVAVIAFDFAGLVDREAVVRPTALQPTQSARASGQSAKAESELRDKAAAPQAVFPIPTPAPATALGAPETATEGTHQKAAEVPAAATPAQQAEERAAQDAMQKTEPEGARKRRNIELTVVEGGLLLVTIALSALTLWRGRLERRLQ